MKGIRLWERIKLTWKILTRGLPFYHSLIDKGYDVYCNHHKIIHWRDGNPVFTMGSPALFSPPMANFIVRNLYGVIQNRVLPNLMSFAITPDCTLKCPQCSFADVARNSTRPPLTLPEAKKVIRAAQALGVSCINLTGGEPLAFPHLDELLRTVDKNVSTVTLFTSGLDLESRAADLRRAGLDGVYVSIDEPTGERHDAHRGHAGLFQAAQRGIHAAKRAGLTVGFSTCAFPDSLATGRLQNIIELGRTWGVHEIVVFSAAPSGNLKDRQDLCLPHTAWIDEIVEFSEKYKEDRRYPGVLIYNHNASWRGLGCSGGTRWFFVDPYGNVSPCDFNHLTVGNLLEEPLHLIWDRMTNLPPFQRSTWTGCKLRDPQFREGPLKEYIQP